MLWNQPLQEPLRKKAASMSSINAAFIFYYQRIAGLYRQALMVCFTFLVAHQRKQPMWRGG